MSAEIEICYGNGMPFVCDSPAAAETPPTAPEPVRVTEDLLRRARAAEQRIGAQVWRGDGGQHIFVGKLIGELADAISARHPEVQPAEPTAEHWREAIHNWWNECCAQLDLDNIEQRARELAGKE